MKQAILWLTQKEDKYRAAWKAWALRGVVEDGNISISPTPTGRQLRRKRNVSPGVVMNHLIGSWIRPSEEAGPKHSRERQEDMQKAAGVASSWYVEEEWILELPESLQVGSGILDYEGGAFWTTFSWCDNPWIKDDRGRVLTKQKFGCIQQGATRELNITRISKTTYSMTIPWESEQRYSQAKLQRCGIAILVSAPPIAIGGQLDVTQPLQCRQQGLLELEHQYDWVVTGPGQIQGNPQGVGGTCEKVLVLIQQLNGVHWKLEQRNGSGRVLQADRMKIEAVQDVGGVVFLAHPLLHDFPWSVSDQVMNKNVITAPKKQPFRRFKGEEHKLTKVIELLTDKTKSQKWIAAGLSQTPADLWAHENELTEYQVWVTYRVVTCQLNLFHEQRPVNNSCRKTEKCEGQKETLEHIFWECPEAQTCWTNLVSQWTGEIHEKGAIESYMEYCASRKSPPIPKMKKRQLWTYEPDEEAAMETMWKRVWRIMCSVCITNLWIQRNRVIFEQEEISADQATQEIWSSCMRQLRAIAKRERRSTNTRISGTRLYLGTQILQQKPREIPSQVETRKGVPALALLSRLRTFQTSCIQ